MVFSKVGPNQSIEWGQIRVSKSTLARIAGHSSIAMSTRYVHPSEEAVLTAMERLGGHKIGHNPETANPEGNEKKQLPF
jgi:hypothetical protein